MAYQYCANSVIEMLNRIFPSKTWNREESDDIHIVTRALYNGFGKHGLIFDEDVFDTVYKEIFHALTIPDYKIPLTKYDIDPSLRQFNCVQNINSYK